MLDTNYNNDEDTVRSSSNPFDVFVKPENQNQPRKREVRFSPDTVWHERETKSDNNPFNDPDIINFIDSQRTLTTQDSKLIRGMTSVSSRSENTTLTATGMGNERQESESLLPQNLTQTLKQQHTTTEENAETLGDCDTMNMDKTHQTEKIFSTIPGLNWFRRFKKNRNIYNKIDQDESAMDTLLRDNKTETNESKKRLFNLRKLRYIFTRSKQQDKDFLLNEQLTLNSSISNLEERTAKKMEIDHTTAEQPPKIIRKQDSEITDLGDIQQDSVFIDLGNNSVVTPLIVGTDNNAALDEDTNNQNFSNGEDSTHNYLSNIIEGIANDEDLKAFQSLFLYSSDTIETTLRFAINPKESKIRTQLVQNIIEDKIKGGNKYLIASVKPKVFGGTRTEIDSSKDYILSTKIALDFINGDLNTSTNDKKERIYVKNIIENQIKALPEEYKFPNGNKAKNIKFPCTHNIKLNNDGTTTVSLTFNDSLFNEFEESTEKSTIDIKLNPGFIVVPDLINAIRGNKLNVYLKEDNKGSISIQGNKKNVKNAFMRRFGGLQNKGTLSKDDYNFSDKLSRSRSDIESLIGQSNQGISRM